MGNKSIIFIGIVFISCLLVPLVSAQEKEFPKRTDMPFVGHTDPSSYQMVEKCHGGTGFFKYQTLIKSEEFQTNLLAINRGVIGPKSSIGEHIHRRMEEIFIVFDAPAQYTVNGKTAQLPAGATVVCQMGSSHGIYNPSDKEIQWFYVAVTSKKGEGDCVDYGDDLTNTTVESPAPFLWAQLDKTLLNPVPNAHHGKGTMLFRRVWSNSAFKTNWFFIDHCLLPPDTSIGYHQHNTIEEVYYIITGEGRSTVNDSTFAVKTGDAIPCRLHDSHGIYNNSKKDLEILVVSCAIEKGLDKWGKEWGEDLSKR